MLAQYTLAFMRSELANIVPAVNVDSLDKALATIKTKWPSVSVQVQNNFSAIVDNGVGLIRLVVG